MLIDTQILILLPLGLGIILYLWVTSKLIQMKDFLVKNSWGIFFIGFFIAMADVLGQYSYIGFGIMLLSFYLFCLEKKEIKKGLVLPFGLDIDCYFLFSMTEVNDKSY